MFHQTLNFSSLRYGKDTTGEEPGFGLLWLGWPNAQCLVIVDINLSPNMCVILDHLK